MTDAFDIPFDLRIVYVGKVFFCLAAKFPADSAFFVLARLELRAKLGVRHLVAQMALRSKEAAAYTLKDMAGDAAGLPFYTMPYVRGESLRARMASVACCASFICTLRGGVRP